MTRRYFERYVSLRIAAGSEYGVTANPATARHLLEIAQQAPADAYLLDAGDDHSWAVHTNAKRQQDVREYGRARLAAPKFTHADESDTTDAQLHAADPTAPTGPFLELVLAGGQDLSGWLRDTNSSCGTSKWLESSDPDDFYTHTPLNQRLMRPNFEICAWLTEHLLRSLTAGENEGAPASGTYASSAFVDFTAAIGLTPEEQMALATHGERYLRAYLGWSGHTEPERLRARVRRITDLTRSAGNAFIEGSELSGRNWLREATRDDSWFYFPESAWLQFHWLMCVAGVQLPVEMAVFEALAAWSKG